MISLAKYFDALKHAGRLPNSNQRKAVEASKEEALFVVAGPGTGKTATLAMRMLKLVYVDQVEPSGILATTFTKKAAAELRSRVLSWGYGVREWLLTQGNLSKIDRLWVEKIDINQIRTGTIDRVCEELLRDFRDPGENPPILADEFVAETLMLRHGMFGAGGVRRDQDPDLSLLLASQCGKVKLDGSVYANFWVGEKTDLVATMWDRFHHDGVSWTDFVSGASSTEDRRGRRLLAKACGDYRRELRKRLMVDFAQLEQTVLERLKAGGLKEFTDQLEMVLVDEYQDTNLLQESLYFELAKRCGGALTVVGDDDQSLYRFRGATVDLFSTFDVRYRTVGGFAKTPQKVFLNANYRSTRTIIKFVNEYAQLDVGYQNVRVLGKPALVNPKATANSPELPVLGMFRDSLGELAEDLAKFVYQVTHGRGFRLPNGQKIAIDVASGGNIGDLALLCSSPKEVSANGDVRLPLALKDALLTQGVPITTFNPRGQDFSSIEIVQLLGGLLLCCLDRNGDAEDVAGKGLSQDAHFAERDR